MAQDTVKNPFEELADRSEQDAVEAAHHDGENDVEDSVGPIETDGGPNPQVPGTPDPEPPSDDEDDDEAKNVFVEKDNDDRRQKAQMLANRADEAASAVEELAKEDLNGEQLASDEGLWLVVSNLRGIRDRLQQIADGADSSWDELVKLHRDLLKAQEREEREKARKERKPGRHGYVEIVAHTEHGRHKLGESVLEQITDRGDGVKVLTFVLSDDALAKIDRVAFTG